jgi:hypothetical protein
MDWNTIAVTIISVLFSSGGVLATLLNNAKKHDAKHVNTDVQVAQMMNEIKQVHSKIENATENLEITSEALKAQLKYTITRMHSICKERNEMSQFEYQCCESLYEQYKGLGGNSFIDILMKDLRELKII